MWHCAHPVDADIVACTHVHVISTVLCCPSLCVAAILFLEKLCRFNLYIQEPKTTVFISLSQRPLREEGHYGLSSEDGIGIVVCKNGGKRLSKLTKPKLVAMSPSFKKQRDGQLMPTIIFLALLFAGRDPVACHPIPSSCGDGGCVLHVRCV